mgnify:CR=1 FL=1
MKRKIFSTLLMGAFFIASMSMFTSCKDYDDDIKSNANDIAALKTQLKTLEAALEKAKQDAATAQANLQQSKNSKTCRRKSKMLLQQKS